MGRLHQADVALLCAGESAFLVAKKLTLEEGLTQSRAVQWHKGFVGAGAGVVNGLGDQFFPSTGFAQQEHGGVARRHPL